MILNFEYVYKYPTYDWLQNTERRSVHELAPIGMSWDCHGEAHSYQFSERGKAISVKTADLFLIVEYGGVVSRSLIIDCDGKIFLDVDGGRDKKEWRLCT